MPTLGTVEQKIEKIEGFKVNFIRNGRKVRADKEDVPQYDYSNAAQDKHTVADWIAGRFNNRYSGYDVYVLYPSGKVASGNTILKTVRGTYQKPEEKQTSKEHVDAQKPEEKQLPKTSKKHVENDQGD